MQVDVFGLVFLLNQSYRLRSEEKEKQNVFFSIETQTHTLTEDES